MGSLTTRESWPGQSVAVPVAAFPDKNFHWLSDEPQPQVATRLKSRSFADAHWARVTVPPVRIIREATPEAGQPFHLVLHLAGDGQYRGDGYAFDQCAGDVVLLDGSSRCDVTHPAGATVLRWSLPQGRLVPFLPRGPRQPAYHLGRSGGINNLLSRYARQTADNSRHFEPPTRDALLTHLCSLVGLAVGAGAGPSAEHDRAPARQNNAVRHRHRILAYIDTHLFDPTLTAGRAAADLGISRRWLHAVLADVSISFHDHVARHRLQQCVRMLDDPAFDEVSITEIAFRSGFNDVSTFYRRFGERFGTTPRDRRRRRA